MLAKDSPVYQRKKDNFHFLRDILNKLHSLPQNIYLSSTQLQAFDVNVSPLNLEADKSTVDGEPQYFQPIPASQYQNLPRPEYDIPEFGSYDFGLSNVHQLRISLSNYMRDELPADVWTEEHDSLLGYSKWHGGSNSVIIGLGGNDCEFRPKEQHDWRFDECYDTENDEYPHVISYTMIGFQPDAETESQLTRGEVIMMIDIIMKRMPTGNLAFHETYPILMIFCFSRKLRFIQGHFDGKLHLQFSKFLDFSKFDQKTFDLFVRWAMSEPAGDTKTPTKPVPRKGTPATHTSKSNVQSQRAIGVH